MASKIKHKVVFITGAANGIGLEIANQFAKNGETVVMSDVDSKKLKNIKASFRCKNLKIPGIECDVTDEIK